MKLKTFQNTREWIDQSVKLITEICKSTQNPKIALSGGRTPLPIYEILATQNLPWDKIEFFQVDEKYVPEDHQDSNCRMIFKTLINKTNTNFHYFDTNYEIDQSLKKYEEELPTTFDLTILEIGTDGHIASLFPRSEALDLTHSVAHTKTEDRAIPDRLTLTFPPILSSNHLLVLLRGAEKESIIEKMKSKTLSYKDFPAKKLTEHKDLNIYLSTV